MSPLREANPYDEILESELAQQKTAARANMTVTPEFAPAQRAAALEAEPESQIPANVLIRTPQPYMIPRHYLREIDDDPDLRDFYARPELAGVVKQSETGAVIDFARTMRGQPARSRKHLALDLKYASIGEVIGGRWKRGRQQLEMTEPGWAVLTGKATPEQLAEFDRIRHGIIPVPHGSPLAQLIGPGVEQIPRLWDLARNGGVGYVVGGAIGGLTALALGQLGPQAATPEEMFTVPMGAAAGARAGGTAASAFRIFQQESVSAYDGLIDLKTPDGEPVRPEVARGAAFLIGSGVTGLEFLSLGTLKNLVLGAYKRGGKAAAAEVITEAVTKKGPLQDALVEFGKRFAIHLGTEASTEVAQEGLQIAGEATVADREFSYEDLVRMGVAGREAGLAALTLGATGATGRVVVHQARQILQTRALSKQLEKVEAAAERAESLRRSPRGLAILANRLGSGQGPIDQIHVPAGDLVTLYQEAGLDPSTLPPEIASQIPQAVATGSDLVLGVGDYLGYVDPEIRSKLHSKIRFEAGGLSLEEADEVEKTGLPEALDAHQAAQLQPEENLGLQEEVQRFKDQLQKRLGKRAAGFVGELYRGRILARASRLGVSVAQAIDLGGIDVTGAAERAQAPAREQTLTALRSTLEELRTGRTPETEKLSKTPILSLLKSLGGIDPQSPLASELEAIGVARSGKGMQPGLFKRGGKTALDKFDLAGRDLFPEFPQGEVNPQAVLDAIDAELRGTPRRTEREQVEIEGRAAPRRELQAALAELGIDLNTPDEEILKQLEDAEGGADLLQFFQPAGDGGARGSITFRRGARPLIRLNEQMNLSTVLHELGHAYLQELIEDSSSMDSTPEIQADLATVREWLGMQPDAAFTVENHEAFARGFEAYLREGRAPTRALEAAFARFRAWLVRIYRSARHLDVELNADVRRVFDRLLASDAALSEVESERAVALFGNAEDANMTPEEFLAYQEARARSVLEAQQRLDKELLLDLARERKQFWLEERDRLRARVEAELKQTPLWRAKRWLQRGESEGPVPFDSPIKLDRDILRERYPDLFRRLAFGKYGVWQADGLDPELVATAFGLPSGDVLVRGLAETGSLDATVDAETQRRMEAEHGSMVDPDTLLEAAREAQTGNEAIDFILTEERALAKAIGRAALPRTVARAAARRIIAETPLVQQNPTAYRSTAAREARLALEALRKKDKPLASTHKRRQLLNEFLEIEARKAREQAKADVQALNGYNRQTTRERIGKAQNGFLEAIEQILEGVQLRVTLKAARRGKSLLALVAGYKAQNLDVVIPDDLLDTISDAPHWSELTPSQLSGIRDAVESLDEQARQVSKVEIEGEKLDADQVGAQLVLEADTNISRKAHRSKRTGEDSFTTRMRSRIRGLDAALVRMEFLVDALGDLSPDSMWRKAIWDPLQTAFNRYEGLSRDYGEKVAALFDRYSRTVKADYRRIIPGIPLLDADGQPLEWDHWSLIMAALNLGNESNKRKLLEGYNWKEEQLRSVLDQHLTAADWEFVGQTWELVESLWPQISAMEKKLTGVVPPKIEAIEVITPHGLLKGGYFPVVYDPRRSALGQKVSELDLMAKQPNGITWATTGHGFTQARTEVVGPLLLKTSVLSTHLDEVLMDLAMREPLKRVNRLLAREDVGKALTRNLGDEGSYRQLWLPWLQTVAGDTANPGSLRALESIGQWMRLGTTSFRLAWRFTTLATQVSGHFNALRQIKKLAPDLSYATIGSHWIGGMYRGFGRFSWASDTPAAVFSESQFMAGRMVNQFTEIREAVRNATQGESFPDQATRFGLGLIARMQVHFVDLPVWIGARTLAIEELNMSPEAAVRFADSVIRKSQGSSTALDSSAIEKASQGWRLWIPFYSYNNLVYNQLREEGRGTTVADVPAFLAGYFMYVVAPGIFADQIRQFDREFLRGRKDDDENDEKARRRQIRRVADVLVGGAVATVPFARDAAAIAMGELPRGASIPQTYWETGYDLVHKKDDLDLMFDVLRTASLLTKVPADYPLSLLEERIRRNRGE